MTLHYEDGGLRLFHGKNLDVLGADALGYPFELGYHPDRLIPDGTYDSIVTDPPYELGFMGKGWDSSGIAYDVDVWRECFRVLKPGGHLLSFGGTRTWHRIAVAIEDAGFEIRDSIAWMYGSGFPKSMDVSKAIDKAAGAAREVVGSKLDRPGYHLHAHDSGGAALGAGLSSSTYETRLASSQITAPATDAARDWEGWGTALKPAFEPIVVARKPLIGTVAANVLAYGTGAINIDECRVGDEVLPAQTRGLTKMGTFQGADGNVTAERTGRFPSNVLLEESQARALDGQSGTSRSRIGKPRAAASGEGWGMTATGAEYDDEGGASRFFPTFRYEAKAPGSERPSVDGVAHATVKPLDLMRWLVRLVTRPGGRVLDLFAGSGTTGEAALLEGMEVDLIELEADHLPLILARVRKPLQTSLFGDWETAS